MGAALNETFVEYKNRKFIVSFPHNNRPRVRERVLMHKGHPFYERWENIHRYSSSSRRTPMYEEIIKLAQEKRNKSHAQEASQDKPGCSP